MLFSLPAFSPAAVYEKATEMCCAPRKMALAASGVCSEITFAPQGRGISEDDLLVAFQR